MKDRIIINKDLIPYRFSILLGDIWFELLVKYNEYADMFTVGLYRDNICLCAGEPLVYGKALFQEFYTPQFPALTIIPVDEAGNNNTVTWENFGETVFLSVYDDDDDSIPYSGENVSNVGIYEVPITFEAVSDDERMAMEQAIIAKGGAVQKTKTTATFAELLQGINSI